MKTCLGGVLKTYHEDVLKTCLEDIFKTSWRQKKWGYLYLTNLDVYVSNKSIFRNSISDESKANPKSLIEPNISIFVLFCNSSSNSILRIKISDDCWCCEISWIQIRHCRTGEAIKTKFNTTQIYLNKSSFILIFIFAFKNIYIKKSSTFANLLMEKQGNWFVIAKMWEKYLRKK